MVFCFSAATTPIGRPIAIAIIIDMRPNWIETGSCSLMMSFTVRLREVKEGPKFTQRR